MRIVSMTRRLTGLERVTRVGEMATGFDIFGETIRDWLEEPDNDEAEPVSLLLAASDDYGLFLHDIIFVPIFSTTVSPVTTVTIYCH